MHVICHQPMETLLSSHDLALNTITLNLCLFFFQFELTGAVFSLDGTECLKERQSIEIHIPGERSGKFVITGSMVIIDASIEKVFEAVEEVGLNVAEKLKQQGACEVLEKARREISLAQDDLRIPKST